ncbi:MAG TPA: hypothetical protein VKS79_10675 [Gemmataceae bacterium]|nr:hypothetical protein [Gemmataceae bacterium]
MSDKPGEFWNVDLARLTLSGWLLMLGTVGVVVGVVILEVLLAGAFALRPEPGQRMPRWVGVLALLPAIASGAGVFEAGWRLFRNLGCPVTRPDRRGRNERE